MATTSSRAAHPVYSLFTGLVAISAWAGAAGLAFGLIDLGTTIDERLPFHSPVFAAIALAALVAAPMTITSWLSYRARPQWRTAGVVAGTMLFGWIVVQLVLIQTFSWLQPVMAGIGLAVTITALRQE